MNYAWKLIKRLDKNKFQYDNSPEFISKWKVETPTQIIKRNKGHCFDIALLGHRFIPKSKIIVMMTCSRKLNNNDLEMLKQHKEPKKIKFIDQHMITLFIHKDLFCIMDYWSPFVIMKDKNLSKLMSRYSKYFCKTLPLKFHHSVMSQMRECDIKTGLNINVFGDNGFLHGKIIFYD